MGADTLHRPPLFQHQLSARSVAALDLLRAFSALFGLTPAADPPEKRWIKAVERALANRHSTPAAGSEFPITRLGRGYAIRINSRSSGACAPFWHSGKLELGRGAPGGCGRWRQPRDTGMDAAGRKQGARHGR